MKRGRVAWDLLSLRVSVLGVPSMPTTLPHGFKAGFRRPTRESGADFIRVALGLLVLQPSAPFARGLAAIALVNGGHIPLVLFDDIGLQPL